MFLAARHGKVPTALVGSEDLVTSNVFGFLKYAKRGIFLRRFLGELLGLSVTEAEAEAAEFTFWPVFPGRRLLPVGRSKIPFGI